MALRVVSAATGVEAFSANFAAQRCPVAVSRLSSSLDLALLAIRENYLTNCSILGLLSYFALVGHICMCVLQLLKNLESLKAVMVSSWFQPALWAYFLVSLCAVSVEY